jgi:mannitol/fructose-specific phosphotransferase system IIA component (Ntr-type)
MITIADVLDDNAVLLNLPAADIAEAVRKTAESLRTDLRVLDWPTFYAGLEKCGPCVTPDPGAFAICLPHARTEAVRSLVMSAARIEPELPSPDGQHGIRYIFCLGVPRARGADYLRIVGLIARILKDPEYEARLREAATPAAFLAELMRFEARV